MKHNKNYCKSPQKPVFMGSTVDDVVSGVMMYPALNK